MPITVTSSSFVPSQAQTNRLVTTDRFYKITPSWNLINPANQSFQAYASNDGGTTWEAITNSTEHTFTSLPTYGVIIRFRFYRSTTTTFKVTSFSFTYEGAISTITIGSYNEFEFYSYEFHYEEATNGTCSIFTKDTDQAKQTNYTMDSEIKYYAAASPTDALVQKWGGYLTGLDTSDKGAAAIVVRGEGYMWKWQNEQCTTTTYPAGAINTYSEIVNDIMTTTGFTADVEADAGTPTSLILSSPVYTKKRAIDSLSEARNKRFWITPGKVMKWYERAGLTDSGVTLSMDTNTNTFSITKFVSDEIINTVEVTGQSASTTRTDATSVSTYGTHFASIYAPHLNTLTDLQDYGDKILADEKNPKNGYIARCKVHADTVSLDLHELVNLTASSLGLSATQVEIVKLIYNYGVSGIDKNDKARRLMITVECGTV